MAETTELLLESSSSKGYNVSMQPLREKIETIVKAAYGVQVDLDLSRPDPAHGDFATNVALQLAKQVGQNPRDIATELQAKLQGTLDDQISEVTVAGPGFINLRLSDSALLAQLDGCTNLTQSQANKEVLVEYSDPNPFKVLHVGHIYDCITGESIAKLHEAAGGTVHRVNFGGDVGLHVGKTMWAIIQALGGEEPAGLAKVPEAERASWLSERYVEGTAAYEDDEVAKQQIVAYNKQVYQVHTTDDHNSLFAQIYWTTRQWSYDYFEDFYDRVGTKFEKIYPESSTAPAGLAAVKEQLANGVFKESDGAIVFDGEAEGLHTRVFINSEGLPTYEAKDIGLAICKWRDYPNFDLNIISTGNDIVEYMKVVQAALSKFEPEIVKRTRHITHGMVKMSGGVKMSSRKGNILKAVDVLDMATEAIKKAGRQPDENIVQGAVKYAFLRSRLGGDIHFDIEESVSLEGNSGPYLQYAHARAKSILTKASTADSAPTELEAGERTLALKLTQLIEVVARATDELAPHLICTYLYELAQTFNRFYEQNRVIGDPRQEQRLYIVEQYADVLKTGLALLGIHAPEKM